MTPNRPENADCEPPSSRPRTPSGLSAGGRSLWKEVTDDWELDQQGLRLLTDAVQTASAIDRLEALVRKDGDVITTPQGPRAHPALVEARQQRIVLARLLSALRVPESVPEEGAVSRPQKRAGVRGTYGLRSVQ